MGKGRTHVFLSLAILLACCACSFASDPSVDVTHREGRADSTPRHFQNIHAQGGLAPGKDLRFTHLTTNDGLSDNRINSILQDRRGFMWFGTEDGLNRYDGNTFVVYKNNPADPNTLSASLIQNLIEDGHGDLWIGTWGGLDKFDPTTERFTRYRYNPDNPNSISGDAIKSIAQDRGGHLWIGTVDGGLNKFDPATETFTHYRNDSDGQFVGEINSIIEDSSREIWFAGPRGLFHLSPQTGQITRLRATIDRLAADYLHEDKAGNLWMLAYSPVALLVKYDRRAERFTAYPFGEGAVGIPFSNIQEDGQHGLWVASSQGLYHFDLQSEQFAYRFQHDETNPDSLDDNSVSSVYRDRAGLLWVGTETGGLNIIDLRQGQFGSYRHRPDSPGSLSPGLVSAMHQDRDGILWAGFTPFALDRLDRKTGQVTHYLPGSGSKNAIGKGGHLAGIYRDAHGYLWLGGWGVLDRFDERSGQFTHYHHKPDDPNSLLSQEILCIYEDRSGRLWVGQVGGLSRFDPATEKFINYQNNPADPASLGSNGVNAIYQDRSGTLWFGTWKGTLSRFDDKTNTFVNLRADSRDPHRLSGGRIHAIHEDQAGTLWLGTADGLYRYNRENETFTHYTENQGLPSGVIQCILDDRSGRLWLGTKKGISRFDPHNETFRNYDVFDGLQSNEFSEGCDEDSQSGEMFFGGNNGITTFFPENIRDNLYVPPVVLTSFKIFNQLVPIGPKSTLKKAIPYVDSLTLSYRDNIFSFEFAALSYANSQKNRYRYKLDNLEPGWNQVGSKQRLATYTNLDPGKYVFRVQASNSDGMWSEEEVSLPILITPPWWRTNWFRALFAVVVLTLLWAAYHMRVRRLAAQFNLRLEERVSERTRIARDLHDTLLQSFQGLLLQFKAISYRLQSGEIKQALDAAIADASQAITEGRDTVQGLRAFIVEKDDLAEAIRAFGEELASSAIDQSPVAFEVVVEGRRRRKRPFLRDEVYRIATEALRNAFRHAQADRIEVELQYGDKEFTLRVRDNGRGTDRDVLSADGRKGHFGLHGMRERAKLAGGELAIWSEVHSGTEIELTIPAARAYTTSARRFWWFRKSSQKDPDAKEKVES
ncbi:MAG TPA: two-component regulator propeller domain-containing protein [Candidatus Sulfotelmatobacter sp.]|nr:two-component regulator propeller domain-containing protein [Candidatus Sulfotelmatobacter sp.]